MDIWLNPKYSNIFIYVKMDVHAGKILKLIYLFDFTLYNRIRII